MAELSTGDWLGFCEAERGTEPDVWADVVAVGQEGEIFLRFGEIRVLGYAPGVIQQGIVNGSIVVKEKDNAIGKG
jgi:hypothetical protein